MLLSTIAGVVSSGGLLPPETVSYLVIAGGGTGRTADTRQSGGGGAGGYRNSYASESSGGGASTETPLSVSVGTSYTVTVGAGGAAESNGSDSVFATVNSLGGGGAGWSERVSIYAPASFPNHTGHSGGSGGGGGGKTVNASLRTAPASDTVGGAGTTNQGYAGGNGVGGSGGGGGTYGSGGGGGAGSAGANGSGLSHGVGGSGLSSLITGSNVTRAKGGEGGNSINTYNGNPAGYSDANAPANSGSGGDGNYLGGSGIVVIRFVGATPTIGVGLTYSETTSGDDTILTFTGGTGTVSWA